MMSDDRRHKLRPEPGGELTPSAPEYSALPIDYNNRL